MPLLHVRNDDNGADVTTTSLTGHPSPAAGRMRLHRNRRRQGLRCVTVELRETEIDALIRRGLLKAETRNDMYAVRRALYQYLAFAGESI